MQCVFPIASTARASSSSSDVILTCLKRKRKSAMDATKQFATVGSLLSFECNMTIELNFVNMCVCIYIYIYIYIYTYIYIYVYVPARHLFFIFRQAKNSQNELPAECTMQDDYSLIFENLCLPGGPITISLHDRSTPGKISLKSAVYSFFLY